jgi:sn-glycerol 3-phosphate transport system permease protein
MMPENVRIMLNRMLNLINICAKLVVMILITFPFFWMVSTSFKTVKEAIAFPPTMFPAGLEIENYIHVFESFPLLTYFKNSVIVALAILVLQYFIIIPAAYSLARHDYKLKPLFFAIVLMGLMIPQQITFVPVYLLFSKMRMLKSFIPLILPFVANSFGIFMLRQYFMQIPQEILEAAKLDDAGNWKIIYRIMIPMARPALITIGLLAFIGNWNSYFWPLIMTSSDTFRTLPVGIATLKTQETMQMWHFIMAGNVILILPIIIVYLFANRRIRNSFVYSGIK